MDLIHEKLFSSPSEPHLKFKSRGTRYTFRFEIFNPNFLIQTTKVESHIYI
jgi:hypothetical protein